MTDIAVGRLEKDAKKTLSIIEEAGFSAMLAGGCVRDRLLKRTPKDFDIATDASPDKVCDIFKQKNLKAIPTGIEHGTVTIVMPSGPVEITTLRKDVSTDGRHATVAFSTDFQEDAQRRDFTINAMFEDLSGNIHDFHDGQADLANRLLRFVGDPEQRIKEDYLRILRLYRFWSRLGFTPEPDSLAACRNLCSGIEHLSQERVTSELLQIFAGDSCIPALNEMAGAKVWERCLPFAHKNIEGLVKIQTTHNQGLARLISALVQSPNLNPKSIAEGLKLDNHSKDIISALYTHLNNPPSSEADQATCMEWLDHCESQAFSWEGFTSSIALNTPGLEVERVEQLDLFEQTKGALRRKALPITGKDLQKAGIQPGPEMGSLLRQLKTEFRNELWSTKEEGMLRVKK